MGNDMLSQEEIDALLRGTMENDPEPETPPTEDFLDELEKDTLGEIANISMGTAATALSLLLGKKVEITTPKVDLATAEHIGEDYLIPSVICNVKYKAGIEGSNVLILSQQDGSVIVDLMMGGDGKTPTPRLSELQISGISEAMNQMIGSAATSMSTMFNAMVEITPPSLILTDESTEKDIIKDFLLENESLVRISFRMVVEDVIDSILIQVIPLSVAKGMVKKLLSVMPIPVPYQTPPLSPPPPAYDGLAYRKAVDNSSYSTDQYDKGKTQGGYQPPPSNNSCGPTTHVQPAQFAPLQPGQPMVQTGNLSLILDVPLQISVELGRAKKTIKQILEMGPGSVIELDRLAGESVDMIVNGKLIAKCEVVVINETFGIRITDIIHPIERMNTLK